MTANGKTNAGVFQCFDQAKVRVVDSVLFAVIFIIEYAEGGTTVNRQDNVKFTGRNTAHYVKIEHPGDVVEAEGELRGLFSARVYIHHNFIDLRWVRFHSSSRNIEDATVILNEGENAFLSTEA